MTTIHPSANLLIGKTAIVTGAAMGLGKAMARVFVREGARVLAADIDPGVEQVAAEIGPACIPFRADISREADVQAMFEKARETFGKLDIVVNNAGTIYSLEPELSVANYEAFTFDDVPGATLVEDQSYVDHINIKLLAGLRKNHLRAIGFVNEGKLGELTRAHQIQNLRRWLAAGMQLGNHTYSHESPNTLGPSAFIADIERGAQVTGKLLQRQHERVQWFRHPYLETGSPRAVREQIDSWLAKHHYRTAPVTMNAEDWEFAAVYDDAIAHHDEARRMLVREQYLAHLERSIAWDRRAAKALFGRDIAYVLLLHATRLSADCMDDVASLLKREGLRPVSLARAMNDPAYRLPDSYTGSDGIDWLERWSLRTGAELPWDDFPEVPAAIQQQYDLIEHDRTS